MIEVFIINGVFTFVKYSIGLVFIPFIMLWLIEILFAIEILNKHWMKIATVMLVAIFLLSFLGSSNTPKYTLDANTPARSVKGGEIMDNSPKVLTEEERLEKLKGQIEENAQ